MASRPSSTSATSVRRGNGTAPPVPSRRRRAAGWGHARAAGQRHGRAASRGPAPGAGRLRATTPAAWIPALGGWLVTRHDLAAFGALRDSLSAAAPASPLAAASAGLSTDEFVSDAAVLLFGGIETTEGMITNAAWHLLSHPDALGAVRAERSLLAAAASGGTVLPAVGQDETVLVVVLSDTHAPRRWKTCPPAVAARLRGADLILHAGDVCTAAVLDELAAYAPVRAVAGNNDGPDVAAWGAPETLDLDLDGLPVAMIHDSGPRQGRMSRLRARFPAARLIVFGHSHIPWNEAEDGVRAFNPGSPTDRRSQPQGTIGLLRIEAGQVIDAHVIPVT